MSQDPDFKLIFESLPGLYLILDPDLTMVAASDARLKATMTERATSIGIGLFELFPDNPDDPAATGTNHLRASLDRVRNNLVADTMAVQKYDIRRPESEGGGFEVRYWSPVNSPVLGADGKLKYIIHRVEDVTEFVRLRQLGSEKEKLASELQERASRMEAEIYQRAQEVAEANRQLQRTNVEMSRLYEKTRELDELKTQFFANVSHELRTPLALILGPAEKLEKSPDLNDSARRDISGVVRNARLLLKHVNDLLDISKLDAGKMTPRYVKTDLALQIRRIIGSFETVADDKRVRLVSDAAAEVQAEVDLEHFHRIVMNLLSNAFKYTPEGGLVRCAIRQDGGRAVVEVADSGPGVPPGFREAIFERFRQLEGGTTRRFGGTGLGLAIVKDLVAAHGGKISVLDAPEGGALFRVELPVSAPEGSGVLSADAESPAIADHAGYLVEELKTPRVAPAGPSESGHGLVLVVEDNQEMNQFVRECLNGQFRTAGARNGREGLEKALELRPDLIVSDLMMPEMGGDGLVKEIRARPDFANTSILLLTAKADDELRVKLLREGAQDYIMKPFSADELRARAGNLVKAKLVSEINLKLNAELKDNNDRLQHLAAQLQAANRELESFSYSVAHDLRTPLRSINGFSEALSSDYTDLLDDQGKSYLKRIQAASSKMAQLIEDLLSLSKVTRIELSRERISLSDLCRAIVDDLRMAEPGRNIDVQIENGMDAQGDLVLLRVLLANLVGNAWKYTSKVPAARIEAGTIRKGDQTTYFIRDNGAGFDMTYVGKLFGTFQRLHTDAEFSGTGIGLAIVQRIINRHGGRIWAEGAVGRGATFYFTL